MHDELFEVETLQNDDMAAEAVCTCSGCSCNSSNSDNDL